MKFSITYIVFISLVALVGALRVHAADDVVVSDGDVTISRAEFEAALSMTPGQLRTMAAKDVGERFELINSMMQVRKLAAEADRLEGNEADLWSLRFQILAMKRQFAFDRYLAEYTVPNVQALAREYYETQKDKYATKPEYRSSSHILLASRPGLPRDEVRAKAQELLDKLRAGADFESMVAEYSDDPSSKARGGALKAWMRFGDPGFTPPYSEALFAIDKIGEYSEITDSQFGIHIIRLDGIRPGGYYSFEESREKILADIVSEYKTLAAKDIASQFGISDDAYIDGPAMEQLFEPYK